MFEREVHAETTTCPECGATLVHERDLLICKEHGAFFAYGPQLLVRAPHTAKPANPLLPWETRTRRG